MTFWVTKEPIFFKYDKLSNGNIKVYNSVTNKPEEFTSEEVENEFNFHVTEAGEQFVCYKYNPKKCAEMECGKQKGNIKYAIPYENKIIKKNSKKYWEFFDTNFKEILPEQLQARYDKAVISFLRPHKFWAGINQASISLTELKEQFQLEEIKEINLKNYIGKFFTTLKPRIVNWKVRRDEQIEVSSISGRHEKFYSSKEFYEKFDVCQTTSENIAWHKFNPKSCINVNNNKEKFILFNITKTNQKLEEGSEVHKKFTNDYLSAYTIEKLKNLWSYSLNKLLQYVGKNDLVVTNNNVSLLEQSHDNSTKTNNYTNAIDETQNSFEENSTLTIS